MRAQEKNIKGFTILELLVVIVIISVISAAAYPNFSSWRKERQVRVATVEIKNLFTNISSQVQRGMYAFVQVHVEEDTTNQILTITSKGMHTDTMLTRARTEAGWGGTTDMETTCNQTQPWDDQGSPTNTKLEVAQLVYDNITTDLDEDNPEGTICFSKDGRYYSVTGAFEIEFPFFYICGRSSTNKSCNMNGNAPPDDAPGVGLDIVFKIKWSRFANITLDKWSDTLKEDGDPIGWVLQ